MKTRTEKKPKQTPEGDLCAEFIQWVESGSDWVCYPETGGFDILLAAPDGAQLGIHAKKSFNATLLRQALPGGYWYEAVTGPDYRGVLLFNDIKYDDDVHKCCEALGLIWFRRVDLDELSFCPSVMDRENWPHWGPDKRIKLPDYIPDVAAGVTCPVRLTEWKVKALRLIAKLEVRGYVVRKDFRDVNLDHRRWTNPMSKWLTLSNDAGANARYVRGPKLVFDKQHPKVYAQVLADMKKWMAEFDTETVLKDQDQDDRE